MLYMSRMQTIGSDELKGTGTKKGLSLEWYKANQIRRARQRFIEARGGGDFECLHGSAAHLELQGASL